MLSRVMLTIYMALGSGAVFSEGFVTKSNCDIPGGTISGGEKATNVAECRAACATQGASCQGYVFISGWNKCLLKSKTAKRFSIEMYAGSFNVENLKLQPPSAGFDHKGKDMEKSPRNLPTPAACSDACKSTDGCKGYTYISGYNACWLKNTTGRLQEKRFYCGYLKTEK